MEEKQSLDENWRDYIRNLTHFHAPISYEDYKTQSKLGRLVTLPFLLVVLLLIFNSKVMNHINNAFIVFWIFILLNTIAGYSTEMRMFHARGKSPLVFQLTHLIFFVSMFIYYMYAVITQQEIGLQVIFLAYLIPAFSTWGNYYFK